MSVFFLGAAIALASCGSSHQHQVASELGAPEKPSVVAPQSGASDVQVRPIRSAVVAPQSGASQAANPRASFGQDRPTRSAVVAPRSGASEAAKAAGAESRKVIIPKIRDVPVSGVTTALPFGVPYASDTDPIRIVSFAMSATVFHPGDEVTGDVVTTSNAASVTAQVGSIRLAVPRVAPGKFHLSLQLPTVPLPPGTAHLVISAIRKDGSTATRTVPITVEF